jgi:hypothetical protein
VEELRPERVFVLIGNQRMHGGAGDGRGEHRRSYARIRAGFIPHEEVVQTTGDLSKGFVLREEPDHDGIAQDGARRAAAFDRQVDDPLQKRISNPGSVSLGFGRIQHRFEPSYLCFGGGKYDLVLRPELVVKSRLRHADLVGNHLQRGAAYAVAGEQLESRGNGASLRRR